MRLTKFHLIAVAAAALVSGPAVAADIYVPPPEAAPYIAPAAYSWTGAYIGVQGGYDWNHATTPPSYSAAENGGIVGVYGGYNWQFSPNWVVGIDLSINKTWARGSATCCGPLPASNSAGPEWKGFIRGRAGWAIDKFLLYGTAGAAVMHYTATTTGPAGSGSATPWGWTVGLGAEMAIHQNMIARLDYAYQNYGSFTVTGTGSFAAGVPVSVTSHTLMAGVGLKF